MTAKLGTYVIYINMVRSVCNLMIYYTTKKYFKTDIFRKLTIWH